MLIMYIIAIKLKIKILVDLSDKITISIEYLDYSNIFLFKFTAKFLKYSNNNYVNKFEESKQMIYGLIYNLKSL